MAHLVRGVTIAYLYVAPPELIAFIMALLAGPPAEEPLVPQNPEASIIWLASARMAPCNAAPKVSGLFSTVLARTIGWYSPQQNL
jgi:hypothetical protein